MRSRRGQAARAVAVVVGLVLLAGCTGGDPGADVSPAAGTPTATPSSSYLKGEVRPDALTAELCEAVSRRTLRRFGMKAPGVDSQEGLCEWREERSDVARELTLEFSAHAPVPTRRDHTPSDEARYRFAHLRDEDVRRTAPVPGLGDEAKVWRAPSAGAVRLAVRHRNVVLDVHVGAGGEPLSYSLLERTALSAVREALGRVTGKPVPAPSPTREETDGEVTEVRDVCGDLPSAGRLVGGARPSVTSSRTSARARGCAWDGAVDGAELDVRVQAMAPSALDGASGTGVAEQAFDGYHAKRLERGGLGDAKIAWSTYELFETRRVELYVREKNLLIQVGLERPDHSSRKRLRRDAVGVAEDVVAGYR